MKRTAALSILVAFVLLAVVVTAEAQPAKKIPRIGYLSPLTRASESARSEGVRSGLRERGYIDGQNITIEFRYAEGKQARLPVLAAELVELKVNLIVAAGGISVIRPAMNATKTIPIVMIGQGRDPVQAGVVNSLTRPGGNVTGYYNFSRDLGGKRLELLKEAANNISRVAVLYDPAIPGAVLEVKESLQAMTGALKLTIQPWEIRVPEDLKKFFAALNKQRQAGLYVTGGPLINLNLKRIVDFALTSRLPATYIRREFVDAGGLMYYGPNEGENSQRVAYFIDRILNGTKPAELPVERPTKFEFIINLKTAKQIGLTIPQWTLMKADRVIR